MITLNVPNVITVGLICLLFMAAAKIVSNATGIGKGWV